MATSRIRVIQLGDLHYPHTSQDVGADNDGFTPAQVAATSSPRLKKVVERIASIRDSATLLAICGDLTDRGDLPGYEAGVAYLNGVLELAQIHDRVVAVPGNHDIDRTAVQPGETDLFKKFGPLTSVWEAAAAGLFEPQAVRRLDRPVGNSIVPVLALNTCILCWEYRTIPEHWQTTAKALLETHMDQAAAEVLTGKLASLQVDAPAVHDEHVESVAQTVGEGLPACVVVGHHALLPQARPRMQINGEPTNAGRLRTELLRVATPVVYLHGHLHDDPVECVSNPAEGHFLASVGAPELKDGFNVVDVVLSSEASFLGLEVQEYRFKQEHLELTRSRRIRFPRLTEGRLTTLRKLTRLIEVGETVNAQEIRIRAVKTDLAADLDLSDDSIATALIESDWAGLLSVDEKGGAELHEWRIVA